MIQYDFQGSLGFWLGSATHEIERALNKSLGPQGVTLPQVRLLACLALRGDLPQHELAEMLNLDRSTVARGLERMERDGWIARRPDAVDRRQKLVSATDRVVPLWQTIVREGESIEQKATAGISAADIALTRSVCERILANLSRML